MGFLRALLLGFLGLWVVGFGLCGGLGVVLTVSTLQETPNPNGETLAMLMGLTATGLLLAWVAFRLALKVYRQRGQTPPDASAAPDQQT